MKKKPRICEVCGIAEKRWSSGGMKFTDFMPSLPCHAECAVRLMADGAAGGALRRARTNTPKGQP